MSLKQLLTLLLVLISLKVNSQNNAYLKGDYANAVTLTSNKKYIFQNAAKGYGNRQEYPLNKAHSPYLFAKERNTSWFSLDIVADGFLTFDIIPFTAQDDFDWMLFKETAVNAGESKIDYNKPVRSNNSRTDAAIAGRTGMKDGFNNLFSTPGPGSSYSKPIEVHQGETYILAVDNIYPGGKGFTFSSTISKALPSQLPKSVISGIITDKQSMLPLAASIVVEDSTGNVLSKTVSDSLSGNYSFKISPKSNYTVSISKKGYVLLNDFLHGTSESVQHNYQLEKLKVGAKIIFFNIHFMPNSATIMNTSSADLNRLLTFLREEKDWKIQIIGHTNANVFTSQYYLQQLSEKRAWAVKNFLLQQGIAFERIRCFGLGGKNPLFDNKKPEEAVKNLRVEVVLEK